MDLGTIARRLESGFYASAAAVAQDVCLVWRNCHTFNEPGSDVYKSCDEIAGFFDQLWKQAKLEKAPVRPNPPLHSPQSNLTCRYLCGGGFAAWVAMVAVQASLPEGAICAGS